MKQELGQRGVIAAFRHSRTQKFNAVNESDHHLLTLSFCFFPLQIQKFLINLCNYILCLSRRDPALLQWWSGSTMRRWLFCLAWWLTPHMFTDSTNLRALKKELSDSLNCTLRPFYQSSECLTAKYISMEASETNNKKNPVSMETNMS